MWFPHKQKYVMTAVFFSPNDAQNLINAFFLQFQIKKKISIQFPTFILLIIKNKIRKYAKLKIHTKNF